ncbi:MAG: hypothetical protein RSA29_18570 [Clostridium sp.]|uniref:hypothetical protein n=1 Tax=Clostridium sp. TaxID=1506 RepID=UPI003060BB76
MKLGKVKEKLSLEVLELRESRKSIYDFEMNLIKNFNQRHVFIKKILDDYNNKTITDKSILEIAASYHLSSLVTCWETFFRDVFVMICDTDNLIKKKIHLELETKPWILKGINDNNITIGDYMSKQFNFQNLQETIKALNFLFDNDYDNISDYVSLGISDKTVFGGANYILYWLQEEDTFSKNINETVIQAFEVRHKIIHDANYKFNIDSEFMTKVDHCFLIIPQCIAKYICKKYNIENATINVKNEIKRGPNGINEDYSPYIFTIRDLDSTFYIHD